MDLWMGLLRFAMGVASGWLLGWLVIRGGMWCWGLRRPKPSGAGERTPIEDLVSHKAMTRESDRKGWYEEWAACLSVAEQDELEELYQQRLLETGLSVPYDMEDMLRRDYLLSKVQERIGHLAAGRPELIERPKAVVVAKPVEYSIRCSCFQCEK